MTDPKTDLIAVGAIAGAHGVRGDVRVRSFTEDPETLFELGPLLDQSGRPLLTPKAARPAKSNFIVTPTAPKSKEDWDALKGTELFVSRDLFPDLEAGTFYVSDLIGLNAFDDAGNALGRVHAVLNHGAGDLIELRGEAAGKGVLIPFTETDVPDIDMAGSRITISTFTLWATDAEDAPKAQMR